MQKWLVHHIFIILIFKCLGKFGKKYLKNYERIRVNTSRRRQLFPKKNENKKRKLNGPDADYGMAEPLPSINPEDVKMKMKNFLNKLKNVNFAQIEIDTREQNDSEIWYQERKIRLTASSFGKICKMRANTSCKNLYIIYYMHLMCTQNHYSTEKIWKS